MFLVYSFCLTYLSLWKKPTTEKGQETQSQKNPQAKPALLSQRNRKGGGYKIEKNLITALYQPDTT